MSPCPLPSQAGRYIGPLPLCFVLDSEQSCNQCATSFKDNDTKHHCRACGEGFCDSCSSKTRPVPERGWGPAPVRVCDNCYDARNVQLGNVGSEAAREKGSHPPSLSECWALGAHCSNHVTPESSCFNGQASPGSFLA